MTTRVLIVDDDQAMRELLTEQLQASGRFVVIAARNASEAIEKVDSEVVDVVLTDLRMPGNSGLDLCRELIGRRPDIPVVLMTAFGSLEAAIEAIRAGAYDFLTKPFDPERLEVTLDRAVQDRVLREEVKRLRRQMDDGAGFEGMIGTCPAMQHLYEMIERVGSSGASVLILGESGSGKELVARALHHRSRRANGPFVALNCAAVPEQLLESELFGHERGAFTDAKVARKGLMREAEKGTLFLDEIGDLSEKLQPKLLRALQDRRIRPVGSDEELNIDVRIIAATHRDLRALVQEDRFRADLFYRLNVITLEVPPLRERGDDIMLLAETFADSIAAREHRGAPEFSSEVESLLTSYNWPGNIRELANCVERCVALATDGVVLPEHLPEDIRRGDQVPERASSETAPPDFQTLIEVERNHILRVLDSVGGNKSRAAKILGIDRKTLHARLMRYEAGES